MKNMRKLAILLVPLLILALVAVPTGCGEDEPATPTPTPSPTITPFPTDTPTQSPTPEATETTEPTATEAPTAEPTQAPVTSLPCAFHGSVSLNGLSVPDGTEITATIEGDQYETTTPSDYGPSTYWLRITPLHEYTTGTVITFTIDGYPATGSSTWESGGNVVFHLAASTGT